MFKLKFLKKNKPSPAGMNPKPLAPAIVWTRIIYASVVIVLITVPLSALLFWEILNQDSSLDDSDNTSGPTLINKERLRDVVEAIERRS